ncbi:Fibrillin-1 [Dirofilaria immitis]
MLHRSLLLRMMLYGILLRSSNAITKSFVNSSMLDMRPTFVVNFDTGTVICQHSSHPDDLHLHQISIICDGKPDCYSNPAMHDESFPYCGSRCNSTCNQRGACLFDGTQGQCYCNAGYHGPQCELNDSNECKEKPCHWLAHCRNTYGSYSCTCFPGFQGDGYKCSDINECETGMAGCPEYSTCVNLPGTYFCNCSEGFQPLGVPLERCADIDECAQEMHNCPENLKCQNEIGKFKCVEKCDTGYRLMNGICIDVNECAEKTSECNKRANCINTIGSYQCICEDGFTGDGKICTPLNDCNQQKGICDRHAFCIGSLRMCMCQSGYIGDGLNCYDVNECEAKHNPCEGQIGASRCVNIDGGYICCEEDLDDKKCIREKGAFCSGGCGLHAVCYNETCQCMEGFNGDPRVKCSDTNECEDDKQCPGAGEWCVNMLGGFVCCNEDSKKPECLSSSYKLDSVRRTFSTASVGQKATSAFVIIDKQVMLTEQFGLACYFGCPADSHCINDTCRCDDGFIGNTFEGCADVNECELDLCNQTDSWCVNLHGSFACCTTNSTLAECIGLEIVGSQENSEQTISVGDATREHLTATPSSAVNGVDNTEDVYESWSGGSKKGELSSNGRRSSWAIETVGEWKNFTGHAIIIGRGKIESRKWNVTKNRNEALIDVEMHGNHTEERKHFTSSIKEERAETSKKDGKTEGSDEDIKTNDFLGVERKTDGGILKVDTSQSLQAGKNIEKGFDGITAITTAASLLTVTNFSELYKIKKEETRKPEIVTSQSPKESTNRKFAESRISLERSSENFIAPIPTLKSSITSAAGSLRTVSNEIITQDSSGKFQNSEVPETSTYSTSAESVSKMESTKNVELETVTNLKNGKANTTIMVTESDLTGSKELTDTTLNVERKYITRATDKETKLRIPVTVEKKLRTTTSKGLETQMLMIDKEIGDSLTSQNQTMVTRTVTSAFIPESKSQWKKEKQKLQPENNLATVSETDITVSIKHETFTPRITEAFRKGTVTVIPESDSPISTVVTHSETKKLKLYGTFSPFRERTDETNSKVDLEIAKASKKADGETGIEIVKAPSEYISKNGEFVEVDSTFYAYPKSIKEFKPIADLVSVSQKIESKKSKEIETTQKKAGTIALEKFSEQSTGIDGGKKDMFSKATPIISEVPLQFEQTSKASRNILIGVDSTNSIPSFSLSATAANTVSVSFGKAISQVESPETAATIRITSTETGVDTLKKSSKTIRFSSSLASQSTTANSLLRITPRVVEEDVTMMQHEKTEPVLSYIKSANTETENLALQTKDAEFEGSGEETIEFRTVSDTSDFISNTPIETNNVLRTVTISDKAQEIGLEIALMKGYSKTTKPQINEASSFEKTTISSVNEFRNNSDLFSKTATSKSEGTFTESHVKTFSAINMTTEEIRGKSSTGKSSTFVSHGIEEATASGTMNSDFKKTLIIIDANTTQNINITADKRQDSSKERTFITDEGIDPTTNISASEIASISTSDVNEIAIIPTSAGSGSTKEENTEVLRTTSETLMSTGMKTIASNGTILKMDKLKELETITTLQSKESSMAFSNPSDKKILATTSEINNKSANSVVENIAEKRMHSNITKTVNEREGFGTSRSPFFGTTTTGVIETFDESKEWTASNVAELTETASGLATASISAMNKIETKNFSKFLTEAISTKFEPESETVRGSTSEIVSFALTENESMPVQETASSVFGTHMQATEPLTYRISTTPFSPTEIVASYESSAIVTNPENFPSLLTVSGTQKAILGSKPTSISGYVKASDTSTSRVPGTPTNKTVLTENAIVFQHSESSKTGLSPITTMPKNNLGIVSTITNTNVLKTRSETVRWTMIPEMEMTTIVPVFIPGMEISESIINPLGTSTKAAKVTSGKAVVGIKESVADDKQASSKTSVSDKDLIGITEQETKSPPSVNILKSEQHIFKNTMKKTYSSNETKEISVTQSNIYHRSLHCRSNDECGADAYCERRSGVCRCYPGFDGQPPNISCFDIDECKRHLDDCDLTSRCSNKVGGFMCFCETGYRMSRERVCEDIDECQERAGQLCSQHAMCINMPGSYQCHCNHGYIGDGYTCIPIEKRHCKEEELARSDCGRNHLCLVDDKGKIDCDTCKKGFRKEATECVDINECAQRDICHENAFCNNIMGSYACRCQPGYQGDGFNCDDIDECLNNPCHPQAICFNYPGFYNCKCPDGWAGDGKNECINPSDTACLDKLSVCNQVNHTSCLSVNLGTLTMSICECAANYRYNPTKNICEDINECVENRHSCDPSNSICVNTDGSYICECAPGYEGVGGICVDVNECEHGIAGCNVAARCENYLGSVGCKCPLGFIGDGIHCIVQATKSFTKIDSGCNNEWKRSCHGMNRTCHIDDEDVPQCGSCLIGYQPSNGKCLPIQEAGNCANPQKNDCDTNAECIDVYPGHHFCTCKVGYIGDGRRCDDIDECSLPGACDPAANCHNINGSFTCVCQLGYIGNGFKCTAKFNKYGGLNCYLNVSTCHKNARCHLDGTCKCNSGYQGDGIDMCQLETGEKEDEIMLEKKMDFSNATKIGTVNQETRAIHFEGSSALTHNSFASEFVSSLTVMPVTGRKGDERKMKQMINDSIGSVRLQQSSMVEETTNKGISVTKKSSEERNNTAITDYRTSSDWINETDHIIVSEGSGEDDSVDGDWQYSTKADNRLFTPGTRSSKMMSVHESMKEAVDNFSPRTRVYSGSTSAHAGTISREETQNVSMRRCTIANQSACHEFAACLEQSGECVCKLGYHGDGYSICMKYIGDCVSDPTVCDLRAVCDVSTHSCRCIQGYIGDGVICTPDIFDCLLRPNLCSSFAECIGRRCVCNAGYTGDGTECVEVEPLQDCTQCDIKAKCYNETCICDKGYFGNGAICIADPADCIHYPGLCHSNAICDHEKRRCKCTRGYIGNGIECSRKKDFLCLNGTNICDQNAECLLTGICQCKQGFEGDGYYCRAVNVKFEKVTQTMQSKLPECKQQCASNEQCYRGECRCVEGYKRGPNVTCMDIDECSTDTHNCHPVAMCINVPGSFTCICPSGYNGNGRKCFQYHRLHNMSVDCELDRMTLILVNDPDLYDGRIFVRGQTDNPFCSMKLNALLANESEYHLIIQYAHCSVRFEEPNTIAVTVVIQRHPMFITERADAYDVRCTYPVGVRKVANHVGISEITTTKTIVETGIGPTCSLTVTNEQDQLIDTATVGQPLKLALTVYPNDTYAVLPRNCFAINLETGELYLLTDENGCAIDTELFPEWTYRQLWFTTARFRTFKWPDSSMIRFQCDCSACIESCPKVNCTNRHESIKQHHFRHIREIPRNTVDEELEKHIIKGAKWMTYSGALHVNEEEELVRAQRDMKHWKYQGLKTSEESVDILPDDICIQTFWIILSLLPLLLLLMLIGLLSAVWRKKFSTKMHWRRAECLTSFNDNGSSYLKF